MLLKIHKNLGRFFLVSMVFLTLLSILMPPSTFPRGAMVEIEEGVGLQTISLKLEEENIIRTPFWFRFFAIVMGGERRMKAGEYYFERPQSTLEVAWRLTHGLYGVENVRLVVFEGFTKEKIANLFDERFIRFDKQAFLSKAPEGYLFPDTYFVPVTASAEWVIQLMKGNFNRQVKSLLLEVGESGHSFEEILIMASILEGEVRTQEDRELVSGILWKRIEIGMPLQVDVDLSTYENRGLPERPVNNPGLISLESALRPKKSPYLYFLTDVSGAAHYSTTFDEHKEKISKFLR